MRLSSAKILLVIGIITAAASARTEKLELGFPDEPAIGSGPGHFTNNDFRAAEMVLLDSGLTVTWQALPPRRMFRTLQTNPNDFCVAAVSITAEREKLGQFSRPFAIDRMLAVVGTKAHASQLKQAHSLAELIAIEGSSFVAIGELNYGRPTAPLLKQLGDRISYGPHSTGQVYDMLRAGRADYGLVTQSVGASLLSVRSDRDDFILVSYPDMHRNSEMAFLCGAAVPAAVIASLNAAITRQLPRLRALFPDQALLPSD